MERLVIGKKHCTKWLFLFYRLRLLLELQNDNKMSNSWCEVLSVAYHYGSKVSLPSEIYYGQTATFKVPKSAKYLLAISAGEHENLTFGTYSMT